MKKKFSKKQTNLFHPVRDSHLFLWSDGGNILNEKNFNNFEVLSLTGFQERVYGAVKKIPRGKVITYSAIASRIKLPRAYRAVGNALNHNRFSDVPCHRVVCSNGAVGGYAWGSSKKIALLRKEGVLVSSSGVVDGTYIIKS